MHSLKNYIIKFKAIHTPRKVALILPTQTGYCSVRHFSEGSENAKTSNSTSETKDDIKEDNDQVKKLLETVKKLELEVKEMKDKVIRSYAEEENVRRIAKKDVENAKLYANTR